MFQQISGNHELDELARQHAASDRRGLPQQDRDRCAEILRELGGNFVCHCTLILAPELNQLEPDRKWGGDEEIQLRLSDGNFYVTRGLGGHPFRAMPHPGDQPLYS